ncbi:hypothetical protein CAL12_14910 [Bordetella genomosp. 8]|uniref:DUF3341 domain-containing protein n=1 Tax=Bordetella genomosp. 8 TaxID=1416806 RepID=A0A1W6YLS9_9BORD|nr:DUF3341 domain-containing protein [Bordetella genomosp. 8]ARP81978.1 hypothetical protein CAL12_14910 [Bordetella genomosp. 8]
MKARLYGLMAEFRQPDALVAAAREVRARGFPQVDAYAPFPVPDLPEAVGYAGSRAVPCATLAGGIVGGTGGYFMQWYAATQSYPINVGGRPLHSWPLFIPVSFELTILCAAICAVVAMLWANGLPRLHHPVFATPDFDLASRDRFFLCVRLPDACTEDDPIYGRAWAILRESDPIAIREVPA